MTITPSQCRAARQLLGWWQSDLAKMVRVSEKSVRAFESGELSGTSLDLDLVREVLESAGVEFIAENGGGAGVRVKCSRLQSSAVVLDFIAESCSKSVRLERGLCSN